MGTMSYGDLHEEIAKQRSLVKLAADDLMDLTSSVFKLTILYLNSR